MRLYQRIEVWVLLLAVAAAVVLVLKPRSTLDDWEVDTSAGPETVPTRSLHLLGAMLERDYGNARLDLDVRVANRGLHPLLLTPPQVRLLAGGDAEREVPPFLLPAERPPEVSPGATSEVRLRYWLEADDLKGALWLQLGEEKIRVKSDSAFDLEQLENRKPVRLGGLEW